MPAIEAWVFVEVGLNSLVLVVSGENARYPSDVQSRAWPAPTLVLLVEVVFLNIITVEEVICQTRV